MAISIVRHKVKDYTAWRKAFDEFVETRKKGGEKSAVVVQVEGNPSDVIVINTWPSTEAAKAFFSNPELKQAMENGGVEGTPEFIHGNDS